MLAALAQWLAATPTMPDVPEIELPPRRGDEFDQAAELPPPFALPPLPLLLPFDLRIEESDDPAEATKPPPDQLPLPLPLPPA